jgi:class 3 adenylate cyclase
MSRKASEIDLKPADAITFRGWAFLTKNRELRTAEGEAVDLRSQSVEVLSALAARPGEIVSKDALMQAVWPDRFVTEDSLTQCIADIRRALGDDGHVIVQTLPKRGYRLNADRVHRRLATVLAADAAGYSRLIGTDEEGTLSTLRAHRRIFDRLIEQHEGRVFGSAGDSVVAEFASPVEAIRCATEVQFEIDRRNADLPEPNRLRFRIGINLGDVVVEGDNLMGDGVNVAARLEALSRPGGICVSYAVYTHAHDRLSLEFVDLGEHKVKNIARPVHAYRVPLASEEQARSPFRGLEAFEFENAELFFGRARAIAACTERAGAASSQRQGIFAHLWDERFREVFAASSRAPAFDHSTRHNRGHRVLAPLPRPSLGGAGSGSIAGRGAASRRRASRACLRTCSIGSNLSKFA